MPNMTDHHSTNIRQTTPGGVRDDHDDHDDHDDQMGKDKPAPPSKLSTEKQLDHALKETFPASDPVSINPGAD